MTELGHLLGDGHVQRLQVELGETASAHIDVHQELERPLRRRRLSMTGVEAFQLHQGHRLTVLFDVRVVVPREFVEQHGEELLDGRNDRWPCLFDTLDDLRHRLEEGELLGVELEAKTGTSGWFLARAVTVHALGEEGDVGELLAAAPAPPPTAAETASG